MSTTKFYERLSENEHDRVNELFSDIQKNIKLEQTDIFNSKLIPKMLDGFTANLGDSIDWKNLHCLVPFYKTIVVSICPYCPTGFDDADYNLIKYYLDEQIVLPIIGDYEFYPSKFIDLILQYPHTTIGALDMNIINNNLSSINCICKDCLHGEGYDFIHNYIKNNSDKNNNSNQSSESKKMELVAIQSIWNRIKVVEYEKYYTNKLVNIINIKSQKEMRFSLRDLFSDVSYTYNYLTSKSLNSNYVLNFDKITMLQNSNFNQNNEVFMQYPELHKLILQGLHLYSPKEVPNSDYINLLIENRSKIQNIAKLIPENYLKETNFIKIRGIFDDINEEVKELSSSKRMGLLKFSTNFMSLNLNLLQSGVLKLCGYKDVNADAPAFEENFKDKTIEYFSEKILPIYLQKPLPLIQLWKLQKEVKRF